MSIPRSTPNRVRRLLPAFAGLLVAPAVWAQGTSTPAAEPPPANAPAATSTANTDENVVVLSPFTVDASKDIGYYAENTLAGSRLNTNVGDLAASITVVTKQQLDDTGALDINDVFLYEANTEGAGTYTPYIFNRSIVRDGIGGYAGDDGQSFGIATANRVRGLGSADTAQNNYPTIARLAFDAYNTNTVEINRGPNSMLFGTGSPAGIVNQSTSEAVLGQQHTTVQGRFGSFGAWRASIGTNVPIGDKLAIYAAALYDSRGFERKPSSDVYRRQYVSVTAQPFKGTKITASYEHYSNFNNRPNYISPADYVTPWLQNGMPGWNPATQMITFADGSTAGPYVASTLDQRYKDAVAAEGLLPLQGNLTDINSAYYLPGISYLAGRASLRYDQGDLLNFWAPNASSGSNTTTLPTSTLRTQAQWLTVGATYTSSAAARAPLPPSSTGATEYGRWTEVSVTDKSIYDWTKYNVQGANYGKQSAETFNIELQQEILPNLNLSAGWFRQEFREETTYGLGQANNATRVYVDTNTNYLDGSPNPYFGTPYVLDSQADTFLSPENNNNIRAMLAYELDFTKKDGWTRLLGHHRFLGLWSQQKTWKNNLRYRLSYDAGDPRFLPNQNPSTPNNFSWAGNAASIQRIFYLGQNTTGTVQRGVNYITTAGFGGPTQANLQYYDWATNPQGFSQTQMSFDANLFYAGGNYGVTRKKIDSTSIAWQGYLWDDRIIPTVGWRRDKLNIQSYNGKKADGSNLLTTDLYTNGFGNDGFWNNLGDPFLVSGDTKTRGVVVRPFKGLHIGEGNSFLGGLIDGLSFHYNTSDNFNAPPGIQVDFFDNPLGKPSGTGKDYGVGFSMFDNKLVLNLNWYESNNKNAPASAASTVIGRTQRIDTASGRAWAEYVVRIRHGQDPSTDPDFDNITVNPLSQQEQDEIAALQGLPYDWPTNVGGTIAGTETDTSKGMELQMIYNPVRSWNIKFTLGQQKATVSDSLGELQAWINYRKPQWEALVAPDIPNEITRYGTDVANGNKLYLANFWNGYGFTQHAVFNDAPSNTTGGTGSPAATYASIVEPDFFTLTAQQGTKVANLREWSSSLITNYGFQEGRLKGIAIGGSVRWQSDATAGYVGETDPSRYSHPPGSPPPPLPSTLQRSLIVFPDLNQPITTPGETHIDLWVSYTTRILDDKARMKIQLNVRDVNQSGGLQAISFNMDGSPAQYRILDPRTWFVTTTFDF